MSLLLTIQTIAHESVVARQACIQWSAGTIRVTATSINHHGMNTGEFWDWLLNAQAGQQTVTTFGEFLKVWTEDAAGVNPVIYVNPTGPCQASPPPATPYSVCLDMPLGDFIVLTGHTPQSTVFVVDGNTYTFDQHIYWSVPYNAIWSWTLVFDGVPLIRLTQTSNWNCHIEEIY